MVTNRTESRARGLCSKIEILVWFLAGHQGLEQGVVLTQEKILLEFMKKFALSVKIAVQEGRGLQRSAYYWSLLVL